MSALIVLAVVLNDAHVIAIGQDVVEPVEGNRASATAFSDLTFPLRDQYKYWRTLPSSFGGAGLALCRRHTDGLLVAIRLGEQDQNCTDEQVANLLQSRADGQCTTWIETGQVDALWYDVHEYIERGSLQGLVERDGPALSARQIERILRELTHCLTYIHSPQRYGPYGMVHRSLKTSDILIRQATPLKLTLTDFRHAAQLASPGDDHHPVGGFAPNSPPETTISVAWDWWSLGIIIYELIIGKHPFSLSDGRWMGDGKIHDILASKWIEKQLDIEQVGDGRWQNLLLGLLTRDPVVRWNASQVQQWLDPKREDPLFMAKCRHRSRLDEARFHFAADLIEHSHPWRRIWLIDGTRRASWFLPFQNRKIESFPSG
jgi:serine/threonine protein kinase